MMSLILSGSRLRRMTRFGKGFILAAAFFRAAGTKSQNQVLLLNSNLVEIWWKTIANKLELCYCIRYVAKHGRDSKSPWSLRQVGVYHQSHGPEGPSAWILVQPPAQLDQQLRSLIKGSQQDEVNIQIGHPMWHLAILATALSNWDEYVDHSRKELTNLVCTLQNEITGST